MKKEKFDGVTRPSNNTYRKRWNEIFKPKTLHEDLIGGFEKEQRDLDESYRQSLKNKKERKDEEK